MGLFKPWMSKNGDRAEKAVAKLKNQEKLTEAALKAQLERTRIAALEKQRDQSVIARVIATDKSEAVRMFALKRCTDDSFLARFARDTGYGALALAAVEQIRSELVLAQVAGQAKDTRLGFAAVDRIRGEQTLAQVARSAEHRDVCRLAVKRIDDEALLLQVAGGMSEHGACAAVEKIAQFPDAEAQLKQFMKSSRNDSARKRAMEFLGRISSDPVVLLDCAFKSDRFESRKFIEKIDDVALLEKTLLKGDYKILCDQIASVAMEKLSGEALLAYALRTYGDGKTRGKAAVELMKRNALRYGRPLAPLLCACLQDYRVCLLAEYGEPRAVAPLEKLAHQHGDRVAACEALGHIQTKEAVTALLRIMQTDHAAAEHAQKALLRLYREAKDGSVRDAIAAIPRRVYHTHYDQGHGSCHGDEACVHFDLVV